MLRQSLAVGGPIAKDMKVTVLCFGALRDYLTPSGRSMDLDLPEGSSVSDVVGALGAPKQQVYAILVGGEPGAMEQVLSDGAEVTLMPPFSGGS